MIKTMMPEYNYSQEVSEDLKKILDLGSEQIKKGETYSTEEVMNRIRNKYNLNYYRKNK